MAKIQGGWYDSYSENPYWSTVTLWCSMRLRIIQICTFSYRDLCFTLNLCVGFGRLSELWLVRLRAGVGRTFGCVRTQEWGYVLVPVNAALRANCLNMVAERLFCCNVLLHDVSQSSWPKLRFLVVILVVPSLKFL